MLNDKNKHRNGIIENTGIYQKEATLNGSILNLTNQYISGKANDDDIGNYFCYICIRRPVKPYLETINPAAATATNPRI
jgi:hypothetical protein